MCVAHMCCHLQTSSTGHGDHPHHPPPTPSSYTYPVGLINAILVDDRAALTNACILVDDCICDATVGTNANGHITTFPQTCTLVIRLIVIRTHQHGILMRTCVYVCGFVMVKVCGCGCPSHNGHHCTISHITISCLTYLPHHTHPTIPPSNHHGQTTVITIQPPHTRMTTPLSTRDRNPIIAFSTVHCSKNEPGDTIASCTLQSMILAGGKNRGDV